VKPIAVAAFGLFFALVAALVIAARRLLRDAERERDDAMLRAEIDALGDPHENGEVGP
jgi:hypothetical protein